MDDNRTFEPEIDRARADGCRIGEGRVYRDYRRCGPLYDTSEIPAMAIVIFRLAENTWLARSMDALQWAWRCQSARRRLSRRVDWDARRSGE